MGNVIGLTPSRTGIAIGRLLNAQLHHMPGSECARCAEAQLIFILAIDTLSASCIIQFGFTKILGVFPLIFLAFKYLINVCGILLSLSFQVNCVSITYKTHFLQQTSDFN